MRIGSWKHRKIDLISYSMTETLLQQVELVNIISLSELRLQRNFEAIVKCLQEHAKKIQCVETELSLQRQQTALTQTAYIAQATQAQNIELSSQTRLKALEEQFTTISQQQSVSNAETAKSLGEVSKQLSVLIVQGEAKHQQLWSQLRGINSDIALVRTLSEGVNRDNEKYRKQSQFTGLKADTAFKKAQVLEESLKATNTKIEQLHSELQAMAQSIQKSSVEQAVRKSHKSTLLRQEDELTRKESQKQQHNQPCSQPMKGCFLRPADFHLESFSDLSQIGSKVEELLRCREEMTSKFQKICHDVSDVKKYNEDLKQQRNKQANYGSVNMMLEKIEELRPELRRLTQRIDNTDDRVRCADKKVEQARKGFGQLSAQVKQHNSAKIQDMLRTLQSDLIRQIKELSNKLDLKATREEFQKEAEHNKHRYQQLSELLSIKCDKEQVKKALLFIEAKLKEIILVVSEDEQREKEALLTKQSLKCASCDRDIDQLSGLTSTEGRNWNALPTRQLRSECLGRFGITKFGALTKKLKRLQEGGLNSNILRSRKTTQ